MKTLIYAVALGISVVFLGYLAFFAVLPLAFIMILMEQHKPKNKEPKSSESPRNPESNNQS